MSFTLWFMGRPAAGKSTLAKRVEEYLRARGLPVENLDGDEIRKHMHPELGFTQEDRRINNRRTAYIAQLLNRNDINVITGMITPFREAQQQARDIVESQGEFVLIYVRSSLEECERRDPKGLYEQARKGQLENFTGVNHPFQEPHNPEIVVDTEQMSVDECIEYILEQLRERGVLDVEPRQEYEFDIDRDTEREIEDRLRERGYLEGESESTD